MSKLNGSLPSILRGLGWRQNPDRSWTNAAEGRVSYNAARQYAFSHTTTPEVRNFEKALAAHNGDVQFARDVSGISKRQFEAYRRNTPASVNPFKKEHGRYVVEQPKTWFHTFVNTSGKSDYKVAFEGDNLLEMQTLRATIDSREQAALNEWKQRHPNGIADRYGEVRYPETSLRKYNAALNRMTPAQRQHFATNQHYIATERADAA